jgi:hypothetical protein
MANNEARRYHLIRVNPHGYRHFASFDAATLQAAAFHHVRIYGTRLFPHSIVMRGDDGRRYSVADSEALCVGA